MFVVVKVLPDQKKIYIAKNSAKFFETQRVGQGGPEWHHKSFEITKNRPSKKNQIAYAGIR